VKLRHKHRIRKVSAMDITTFMIAVFCLIEDFLSGRQLRRRGPQPTLRDSVELTRFGGRW
jgi:hypothetical protein